MSLRDTLELLVELGAENERRRFAAFCRAIEEHKKENGG